MWAGTRGKSMAQVDTGIYQSLIGAPKSVADYSAEMDRADLARGQLAAQKVNLIGAQQDLEDQQKLRALYQRPGFDPLSSSSLPDIYAASPKAGMAAQKAMLENQKTQADIGKTTTETKGLDFDQAVKRKNEHLKQLVTVSDVPGAVGWINDAVRSGELPMQQAQQVIAGLQSGQIPLTDWRQKAMLGGLTSQEQLAATKPVIQTRDTGGQVQTLAIDPLTGKPTVTGSVSKTVSPGEALTAQTSRANNAATIAKDYKVAGLDANGNFVGMGADAGTGSSPLGGMVDAIGQYKTPEGVALGRVPPAMKAQVLGAVMQKYPDYDPSTFTARQKAARDFSTGSQGNALRSFAVAGDHLDQLGGLIDALNNRDNQTVNKIGNAISAWSGGTAPTNFDAAKDVVSKEVIKAIVGAQGGVAERQELAGLLDNAKTPAQLKGVVMQYRQLMAAQHDHLLQQRRAAGLSDSTLPNYSKDGKTATHPPDIAALIDKYGAK